MQRSMLRSLWLQKCNDAIRGFKELERSNRRTNGQSRASLIKQVEGTLILIKELLESIKRSRKKYG